MKTRKKPSVKKFSYEEWLQQSVIRVGRIYFVIAAIYVASVVAYDAFKLITPDALLARWIMASSLLIFSAMFWYAARAKDKTANYYSWLIYGFISLGIVFASFNIYIQRGMASRAVLMYVIPLIVAALLLRRAALYFAATLAIAAYSLTAVWYSVNNPSEGYKIELYGEVGLYSALLFVVAALLWSVIRSKNSDSS